jgi:hypothetical protein
MGSEGRVGAWRVGEWMVGVRGKDGGRRSADKVVGGEEGGEKRSILLTIVGEVVGGAIQRRYVGAERRSTRRRLGK